jgi:photosystem II stability/assembly factor-like uncharacterized protein
LSRRLRTTFFVSLFLLAAIFSQAASWVSLGPEGGDARSLAYDPSSPDRIYLGTSAGELFLSTDNGGSWSRLAHLGSGFDYVLDSISVDPKNPATIYVGAWSIENSSGAVFKSIDRGQTWQPLPGAQGKSVRAMALAPSDPNTIVIGALDGVYRSTNAGQDWEKITADNPELKNFESIAVDPTNPQVIYAGTWHLPWKTSDGGKTWSNIKQGIIDDSDVFSIIIDDHAPSVVYASACSGIYKSDSAGQQFKKVQGIPFSARRTRVLQQDPVNHASVYAGTTEGLWRTRDSGTTWSRISPANYVVNDVLVDPRDPNHVLIATDRTGVLVSRDSGATFSASNHGFAHRQVTSVVADEKNPSRLYVSIINNREFGGVFTSDNGGTAWQPLQSGLGTRDVFSLTQAPTGTLIAGTNQGVFTLDEKTSTWKPVNTVLTEKSISVPNPKRKKKTDPKTITKKEWKKSEITGRVFQIKVTPDHWFAATSQGLFRSLDEGKSWTAISTAETKDIIAFDVEGDHLLAASPNALLASNDKGESWQAVVLPAFASRITHVTFGPKDSIWIATHMGSFRTADAGKTWTHIMVGQPATNVWHVSYDRQRSKFWAVAGSRNQIYESPDGDTWTLVADSHWPIRNFAISHGRLLAVTDFNGVMAQNAPESAAPVAAGGGGRE